MAAIDEVVISRKRGSSFNPAAQNASLAVKNAAMAAKYAAVERLCETLLELLVGIQRFVQMKLVYLWSPKRKARPKGFEPLTPSSEDWCSIR